MSTETKNTTTTTTVVEKVQKIDIFAFLDTNRLTRAERSYYEKHYASYKGEEKSIGEWQKVIKFIH